MMRLSTDVTLVELTGILWVLLAFKKGHSPWKWAVAGAIGPRWPLYSQSDAVWP
jgi:hypothetical protein